MLPANPAQDLAITISGTQYHCFAESISATTIQSALAGAGFTVSNTTSASWAVLAIPVPPPSSVLLTYIPSTKELSLSGYPGVTFSPNPSMAVLEETVKHLLKDATPDMKARILEHLAK